MDAKYVLHDQQMARRRCLGGIRRAGMERTRNSGWYGGLREKSFRRALLDRGRSHRRTTRRSGLAIESVMMESPSSRASDRGRYAILTANLSAPNASVRLLNGPSTSRQHSEPEDGRDARQPEGRTGD